MRFLPFVFAVGTMAPQQVSQPVLPVSSDAYCFVKGVEWPDGKSYDATAHLHQADQDNLQIEVGKMYVHPALTTPEAVWPHSATMDPMSFRINGPDYGNDIKDIYSAGNVAKFGGENGKSIPSIGNAEKKTVAQILGTPGCVPKK